MRGLKLGEVDGHACGEVSHPTWVRGLKLAVVEDALKRTYVAPYVGAWIETRLLTHLLNHDLSHPTWVRGLKPY